MNRVVLGLDLGLSDFKVGHDGAALSMALDVLGLGEVILSLGMVWDILDLCRVYVGIDEIHPWHGYILGLSMMVVGTCVVGAILGFGRVRVVLSVFMVGLGWFVIGFGVVVLGSNRVVLGLDKAKVSKPVCMKGHQSEDVHINKLKIGLLVMILLYYQNIMISFTIQL